MNLLVIENADTLELAFLVRNQDKIQGWFFSNGVTYLLKKSIICNTQLNIDTILSAIAEKKFLYFLKFHDDKGSLSVCKNIDEIIFKELEFQVEAPESGNFNEFSGVARAAAAADEESQRIKRQQQEELEQLKNKQQELAQKYSAAVDEKVTTQQQLLQAFASVLNEKKRRISELSNSAQAADAGSRSCSESDDAAGNDNHRDDEDNCGQSEDHGSDESVDMFPQPMLRRKKQPQQQQQQQQQNKRQPNRRRDSTSPKKLRAQDSLDSQSFFDDF